MAMHSLSEAVTDLKICEGFKRVTRNYNFVEFCDRSCAETASLKEHPDISTVATSNQRQGTPLK
jgi:hypothetical protein